MYKMNQQHVQRWRKIGYLTAKWGDLFANEKVIKSVKDEHGQPVLLPMGSKLMMACVIVADEETKIASELVHEAHTKIVLDEDSKARFFIGMSNYHDNENVDPMLKTPVGSQAPLNNNSLYSHMRPSLTSAEGRNFGDIATPLWIDAWQMDSVGIRADPTDGVRKPSYINALFYKFDRNGAYNNPPTSDTALNGVNENNKGVRDMIHTKKYFDDDKFLKLQVLYEYITVPRPLLVKTAWGESSASISR